MTYGKRQSYVEWKTSGLHRFGWGRINRWSTENFQGTKITVWYCGGWHMYTFVQPIEDTLAKSDPNVNYGLEVMMCQCRFINCIKSTTLTSSWIWEAEAQRVSVPSCQCPSPFLSVNPLNKLNVMMELAASFFGLSAPGNFTQPWFKIMIVGEVGEGGMGIERICCTFCSTWLWT